MIPIRSIYSRLLACHGPQGWWPIVQPSTYKSEYHINAPRNGNDVFEIAIGAILTQNVAWKNVETALVALKKKGLLETASLDALPVKRLAGIIRPTGYYNQKAIKIKAFLAWCKIRGLTHKSTTRTELTLLREDLLSVFGIGPETADSILLYGLNCKIFVVDAYTRRIFSRLGILSGNESYSEIQMLFHKKFRGSIGEFKDYHALIVAHGKQICNKKPSCDTCCLSGVCARKI